MAKYKSTVSEVQEKAFAGVALGNATDLRTPPHQVIDFSTGEVIQLGKPDKKQAIVEARRLRFKLQDAARHILYGFNEQPVTNEKGYDVHHRTCTCNHFRLSSTAQIVKSKSNNKARFTGLMMCANASVCPVCAATINERKANEMRTAFNQIEALGLKANLLTFTAPHTASDNIHDLTRKISDALAAFWRGKPAQKFKQRYGIVGNIRSFEVRYGSNGWHPHFHIIIFSRFTMPETKRGEWNKPLPIEQQSEEWQWILERWQNMCVNAGLSCPNEYGLDLQDGSQAGEYISKFGSDDEILKTKAGKKITWDMADEMTKGMVKMGRSGSLSPWDLLALSVDADTTEEKKKASTLFLFYARAMKGVTMIKWSRGLRDLFGLGKQATDEEILKEEQDKCDLLCHITPVEWKYIIENKLRSTVLELAENGGVDAMAAFLFPLDGTKDFDKFKSRFINRSEESNTARDEDMSRVVMTYSQKSGHTARVKPEGSKPKSRKPRKQPDIIKINLGDARGEQMTLFDADLKAEIMQVIRQRR